MGVLLVSAILAAATVGCTGTRRKLPETSQSGQVSVGVLGAADADRRFSELVYNGLMRLGSGLQPVCDLCESYEVSPDNRTLTFRLRRNVAFHDGKPLTAADVVRTYQLALQDGRRAHALASLKGVQALLDERDRVARLQAAGRLDGNAAAERLRKAWQRWLEGPGREAVAAPDDFTVTFAQAKPYAPLLAELTLPIRPVGQAQGQVRPPGTGPYKVKEVMQDGTVRLVRYDGYYLGKPHIPAVDLVPVKPQQAGGPVAEGRLDVAPVDARRAAALQGVKGVTLESHPILGYQYLGVNHDSPLFADKRVRQALLYAIDRERLVREALGGHGVVVNSPLHPELWVHVQDGLEPYQFSPQRAMALMAEVGWSRSSGDGPLLRDGQPFAFTLKVPEGDQVREAVAGRIQEDLKALGIKVTVQRLPFAQVVREVFGERTAEAWLLGWELAADPEPGPAFRPDNKWGRASGWSNEHAETLLRQGRILMAPEQRVPFYQEWERLVNEELPYLFLYAENEVVAVRADRIRGVKPDTRGAFWNIQEWRLVR